jgi:hypothetical protein
MGNVNGLNPISWNPIAEPAKAQFAVRICSSGGSVHAYCKAASGIGEGALLAAPQRFGYWDTAAPSVGGP